MCVSSGLLVLGKWDLIEIVAETFHSFNRPLWAVAFFGIVIARLYPPGKCYSLRAESGRSPEGLCSPLQPKPTDRQTDQQCGRNDNVRDGSGSGGDRIIGDEGWLC